MKEGNILGIRRGYPGFYSKHLKPVLLTREVRAGTWGLHALLSDRTLLLVEQWRLQV